MTLILEARAAATSFEVAYCCSIKERVVRSRISGLCALPGGGLLPQSEARTDQADRLDLRENVHFHPRSLETLDDQLG